MEIQIIGLIFDLYSEELTLNGEALEIFSKGLYNQEIIKSNEKLVYVLNGGAQRYQRDRTYRVLFNNIILVEI